MRDIHIALTIGGSNISFRFQIPTHALLRLSRGERQQAEFNVKLEKKNLSLFIIIMYVCNEVDNIFLCIRVKVDQKEQSLVELSSMSNVD